MNSVFWNQCWFHSALSIGVVKGKTCNIEIQIRGHSRLSKLVSFDSQPTVSY